MSTSELIRLMLVDDQEIVHLMIKTIINSMSDVVLIATCFNGQEAIQLCSQDKPDVILMDINMPIMNGIEASQVLHKRYPEIKILALSAHQEDENIRGMLEGGATGYILKNSLPRDLSSTIRNIKEGKAVFSYEVLQTLMNYSETKYDFNLTKREIYILSRLITGDINAKIAHDLGISQSTIKFHINNIQLKMNVNTRIEAIALAIKHKII